MQTSIGIAGPTFMPRLKRGIVHCRSHPCQGAKIREVEISSVCLCILKGLDMNTSDNLHLR
jgi:hypothetical protein